MSYIEKMCFVNWQFKSFVQYIRVTEGKNEKLKKEGKMKISILIFIYTLPKGVHKI